jgi:hypothetical protein
VTGNTGTTKSGHKSFRRFFLGKIVLCLFCMGLPMPFLPMLPTNEEKYSKNTKEQYEMLGRFVEAFERTVDDIREISIGLTARDGRNAKLTEIVFHHQALTAKPLFEIMRALIVEAVTDTLKEHEDRANNITNVEPSLLVDVNQEPLPLTLKDRDTLFGVLTFLQSKFETLANRRNDLLHGTWFVGYVSTDDPNSENFYIRRFKTTKKGLAPVSDLPKTAKELGALTEQLAEFQGWLSFLEMCLEGTAKITDSFQFDNKTWWLVLNSGNRTTLP